MRDHGKYRIQGHRKVENFNWAMEMENLLRGHALFWIVKSTGKKKKIIGQLILSEKDLKTCGIAAILAIKTTSFFIVADSFQARK